MKRSTVHGGFCLIVAIAATCGCSDKKGIPEIEVPDSQTAILEDIRSRGGLAATDPEDEPAGIVAVNLSGTNADDDVVRRLSGLPKLQKLVLARTKITDAAVPILVNMKTLTLLDVTGTGLSDKSKATLRSTFEEINLIGAEEAEIAPEDRQFTTD